MFGLKFNYAARGGATWEGGVVTTAAMKHADYFYTTWIRFTVSEAEE